jgi:hypothetical protein
VADITKGELPTMTPYCPDHTAVVESLGKIEGRLELIKENQERVLGKLEVLTSNGSEQKIRMAETAGHMAVERAKLQPLFWFIASVGAATILVATDLIVRHFWLSVQVTSAVR